MKRPLRFAATGLLLLCIGIAAPANAESLKDKLTGAWSLEAGSETSQDGKKVVPWSAGSLILASSGQFSFFIVGKDRPKGGGDPRIPVGPLVGYYGTYTVNEADNTFVYKIEHATNSSFDGGTRTLKISFQGDAMTTTTDVKTPQGTIVAANTWKRAK
jgi:hypothetical protein